ncbi:hypothetical protein BGZ61DRAFT_454157 [Ilyonectria robusta]|uniref:uncharacterized protein n=1 Tax=Ilyonectria robusta TaxID=1079257 RepID=UPI001E8D29E4|nr:uncharacterized protein BGZ61DRAFT_454157 [Ilyonectria robusta]KAH8687080.1 hypothetical protein BGZ61DRAFT_454157 [Ilyonectria robusta]
MLQANLPDSAMLPSSQSRVLAATCRYLCVRLHAPAQPPLASRGTSRPRSLPGPQQTRNRSNSIAEVHQT